VLLLYAGTGGAGFDLDTLDKAHLTLPAQMAVGVAVLVAAACFLGIAPLHGGLRTALSEAPVGVAVQLAGIVSRLGALLLLRLLLVANSGAALKLGSALSGLAVATAIYAGVLALAQLRASGDVRRLGALLALLPGAVTLLAIAGESPLAFDGAIFTIFTGGLAAALLVGGLATASDRAESRSLQALGGAGVRAPVLTWLLVLGALGVLGFPGFGSYLGALMTFFGSIRNEPGGTFGVLAGLILGAAALAGLLWRVAFGPPPPDAQPVSEATIPERWYLAGLATALIWVGVVPSGPKVAGVPILDPGFVNVMNASTSDQAAPYAVPVPKAH
jgi:NADH:ubiquinone oxidoreductase subunit 4 (subunit M)